MDTDSSYHFSSFWRLPRSYLYISAAKCFHLNYSNILLSVLTKNKHYLASVPQTVPKPHFCCLLIGICNFPGSLTSSFLANTPPLSLSMVTPPPMLYELCFACYTLLYLLTAFTSLFVPPATSMLLTLSTHLSVSHNHHCAFFEHSPHARCNFCFSHKCPTPPALHLLCHNQFSWLIQQLCTSSLFPFP